MIVRILGEGRFELSEQVVAEIEALDDTLGTAIEAGDTQAMDATLHELIDRIRSAGTPIAPDDLRVSDLVVPHEGSSLEEVRSLLAEEA